MKLFFYSCTNQTLADCPWFIYFSRIEGWRFFKKTFFSLCFQLLHREREWSESGRDKVPPSSQWDLNYKPLLWQICEISALTQKVFLTWTVFTYPCSDEEKMDGGWPRDNIKLETCHPLCQHVKLRVASSEASPTAGCWHPGSDNGWSDDWLRSNTLFHIFIVFKGAALTHFHSSVVFAWRSVTLWIKKKKKLYSSPGKQNKNIYLSVYSLPDFSIELPAQAALWNTSQKKKCLQLLVH